MPAQHYPGQQRNWVNLCSEPHALAELLVSFNQLSESFWILPSVLTLNSSSAKRGELLMVSAETEQMEAGDFISITSV